MNPGLNDTLRRYKLINVTDTAINQILKLQEEKQFDYIRLGIQPAGCAGFEYIFSDTRDVDPSDIILDYGKFSFIINPDSVEYIEGTTLDYIQEGLNRFFKYINPKEKSACGCGISVTF